MIFKNLYRNTDYIIVAFLAAFFIVRVSRYFRFSDYRWIYVYGNYSCYLLQFFALLLSLINSILILKEIKQLKEKIILVMISLVPVYFWIYLILSI